LSLLVFVSACKRPPLFELDEPVVVNDPGHGMLVARLNARIHPEVLTPGRQVKIRFDAPGLSMNLTLDPVPNRSLLLRGNRHAWVAKVPNGGNEAFFMLIDGWAEARVPAKGKIYRLRSLSEDRGVLEIFAGNRFPHDQHHRVESAHDAGGTGGAGGGSTGGDCKDPRNRVDLMVLYTNKAACQAAAEDATPDGGVLPDAELCADADPSELDHTPVKHDIYVAVGAANFANLKSKINHRLNLVYTGLAAYAEGKKEKLSDSELLGFLANGGAGGGPAATEACYTDYGAIGDQVAGLGESAGADLVSVVYEAEKDNDCGRGNEQQLATNEMLGNASVVMRNCLNDDILAHETGHNLGALHNRESGSAASSLPVPPHVRDNYGHIEPNPGIEGQGSWLTVMSYRDPGCNGCERIHRFSNPAVSYPEDSVDADPTGSDDADEPEYNVRIMNVNGPLVSQYRCLEPGGEANVWMKDFWPDQGDEPHPEACAGQPMWRSPWIWVRNDKDLEVGIKGTDGVRPVQTYEHQHEHQNPIDEQDNYVYVMIRNSGGAASDESELELYYAKASTGLNSTDDWTRIEAPKTRTIAAGAVEVAEFIWDQSAMPGTGHYCLLARWNEDKTPFEDLDLSNLSAAVRADNDLIWRNLNIIKLDVEAQTTGQRVRTPAGGTRLGGPSPDAPSPDEAVLEVPHDRRSDDTYLLITTTRISDRKIAWEELARTSITIDPALIRKGFQTVGMEQVRKGEFAFALNDKEPVKLLGPITLEAGQKTEVKLKTVVRPGEIKKLRSQLANPVYYDITISQIRPDGVRVAKDRAALFDPRRNFVVGGVSYTLQVPAGRKPKRAVKRPRPGPARKK
jgi:hypothetical protein